jgi:hypothetical protein
MTLTTGLTTQELTQYCANSHDAFVRKAGERLQEAAVMAYELRTERDNWAALCAATGEDLRVMRAECDEARALLREVQAYVLPDDERARRLTDRIDAALKGDVK